MSSDEVMLFPSFLPSIARLRLAGRAVGLHPELESLLESFSHTKLPVPEAMLEKEKIGHMTVAYITVLVDNIML